MSDTPRTDAEAFDQYDEWLRTTRKLVPVDFARTLERELAAFESALQSREAEHKAMSETACNMSDTPRTDAQFISSDGLPDVPEPEAVVYFARTLERALSAERSARLAAEGALIEERQNRIAAVASLNSAQQRAEEFNRALCSLTPGGSEYAGDAQACVAYVRKVRDDQNETIIKFKREKDTAEQRAAEAERDRRQSERLRNEEARAHLQTINELDTALAAKETAEAEIEALKHDIARHVEIAATEATRAEAAEREAGANAKDAERLDAIAENYWKLDPFDRPTGGGDADVGWRVIQYHRGDPSERTVAKVYEDDPRSAIDAAILSAKEQRHDH